MRLTRMLVIVSLLLSPTSCGPIQVSREINPDFVPIFLAFMSYASERSANISQEASLSIKIQYATLPYSDGSFGTVVGYCYGQGGGNPSIQIDEEFWAKSDAYTRESLLFHELGHCLLNRGHSTAKTSSGTAGSLMNAILVDSRYFNETTLSYYVGELFSN